MEVRQGELWSGRGQGPAPHRDDTVHAGVPWAASPNPPVFQGHLGPRQVLHHLQILLQGRTGKPSDRAGAVLQDDPLPLLCCQTPACVILSKPSLTSEHQASTGGLTLGALCAHRLPWLLLVEVPQEVC